MLSEKLKFVKLLAPAADAFNTDPASDVISLANAEALTALVAHKGGTTGKAKIQFQACSANDGSGAEAVVFSYRKMTTGDSDVMGAITNVTDASVGVETVATEDTLIECYIRAAQLPAGKPFVRVKLTETANDPVVASVVGILSGLRYQGSDQPSALS